MTPIDFELSVAENHATFTDTQTGRVYFIDSFDNRLFHVRAGSWEASSPMGDIKANTNAQLKEAFLALVKKAKPAPPAKDA